MGRDTTELELSVESTSFVNQVNDQVRKRQKRISNVAEEGEEHSIIWGMFMAVTMNSATFMGKNFQDNQNSIVKTTDLTLKKMFDISAKLVGEQDEISNVDTIHWEKHSCKYLSLIGDETIIPHREEPLLDGNAHSVRYGERIHDGSGKPEKLNHQEEADSEIFVMGSDAAEFANKVEDQVRKRQKRVSNVADSGEEHSIIW